ncbi:peptidoglycan-binding protein [Sphaerisporangium corydalis]|uniref:Peptidoglycan-binding protein n=1 Tax=Sphaerisporangium corydalis TaxID=1441875 RepID=A0ABV9EJU5_9ACTN|nr:peptidoglycan-binding protein [Sphaerisporangium corydalis]
MSTTDEPEAYPRRNRRARTVAVVAGCTALLAGAVAAAVGVGGGTGTAVAERTPPATAKVTRTTLTESQSVDGTLGYGDTATVSASSPQGTVTWLPSPGAVITRGRAVYSVDADRVPLLYGSTPLYRTLKDGVEGKDVAMLERNLAKLGYDGFTVDDEFTWTTREAVKEWQEDIGVPVTGQVEPSAVVVHDGAFRVADVKATLGGPGSGPVLTYTGTTRQVTVALDVADRHLVKKGMKATVELPDGSTVPGTVKDIGKVATESTTQDETTTTIEMLVSIRATKKLRSYDTAPVSVTMVAARRKNVLTVPVSALLALAEGGYGVQVVEGPVTRYAAVTTGMFADGKVEVTGVDDGATVVVPK